MLTIPFINFFGDIVADQRNQEAIPSTPVGTPLICGSGPCPSAKPAVKRASPAENQAVIPDPEQGNRIGPESVGRLSICGNRSRNRSKH